MSLKRLTPYKKLKELQEGKISKDFKVSNICPIDNLINCIIVLVQ